MSTPDGTSILLRDIIDIPETAGAEDYVLKLTAGVESDRMAQTIKEYVVTDALAEAFDAALGLIAAALREGRSRAAFLSGSFGSGKSHFMAMLYALLGGEPAARDKPKIHPVVAKHDPALAGKKILRLAFHFLDARSIEETVFGGYLAQIQTRHPGCDLPAVHRSDAVLADGEQMRQRLGDAAFFAGLNEHMGVTDAWSGVLEAQWTADSYAAARAAALGSEDRQKLVSALVRTYFTAFTQTGEFVPLDEGLAAISRHAKGLGYDAIVMFLDELVLWLSFSVRDREFFGREAQKITKLVESGLGERAIPMVSFVARQLDLRRYFVDMGAGGGAEQDALDKAFRHQEGRFLPIVLGDDNLPYVAKQRLLWPKNDAAKATLEAAFTQLDRRPEVWDVLLDGVNTDDSHRGSDQEAFRRTYPFSPALVSTLRTLASAMQRDRTALKVMQKLLVDNRAHLTIDDVVPVGDIFDLVVDGNQALTPEMAGRFKNARALYHDKLRPELLREHKLAVADLADLPREHPFRADDRLVKTLVLAAVAPEVPALKELTPARLAALNHGSITAPAFRGREGELVLAKLRRWQSPVPEIQISGDTRNPVVRARIAEVDYESIIERAKAEDNDGRRRETLKKLVWAELALKDIDGDAFGVSRQVRIWRGSRREVEVIFGNIRDRDWLTDGVFEAGVDSWRFVIDYPFDEDGHSSLEDLNRVDALRAGGLDTRTVVWVPHFLSAERQRELGRLVILDWLLGGSGDRWSAHADHLAEADRVQARIILETQRDSLRQRLRHAIQEAYGAASPTPGTLERLDGHERVLLSLDREFDPAAPIGHDLAAAFSNLVEQAFTATFSGHPRFEPEDREVTRADLAAVLAAVEAARREPDGRAAIDTTKREAIRRVANPLGVGHMGETHFLFGSDRFPWDMKLSTAMGRDNISPSEPVQVKKLRAWLGAITPPAGLRTEVTDLIICAWAVLHTRAWYRDQAPMPAPAPGTLAEAMELRPEPLPATDDWAAAVRRAAQLFGVLGNDYLTGQSVTELTEAVRERVVALKVAAGDLVTELERAYSRFDIGPATSAGRLATARSARDLLGALLGARDRVAAVATLARYELAGTPQGSARSLAMAAELATGMRHYPWDRLRPVRAAITGSDARAIAARGIIERVRAALTADELAQPLLPALKQAEDEAFQWALQPVDLGPRPPVGPGADPSPGGDTNPGPGTIAIPGLDPDTTGPGVSGLGVSGAGYGRVTVAGPDEVDDAVTRLREFAAEHTGHPFTVEWRIEG